MHGDWSSLTRPRKANLKEGALLHKHDISTLDIIRPELEALPERDVVIQGVGHNHAIARPPEGRRRNGSRARGHRGIVGIPGHTELDRFAVITRVRERRLTQSDYARRLPNKAPTVWCLASEADPAAVGFRISSSEPSLL
jgi:hypothetical protein